MQIQQRLTAVKKLDSLEVAGQVVDQVIDKVGVKIQEKILDVMRPRFVRKQMIQHMSSVVGLSAPVPDLETCSVDSADEDEPVSSCLL